MSNKVTHFGFENVRAEDKAHKVAEVFDSVAGRYDVMNDLMSFGIHRLWKRYALSLTNVRPGQTVLDLAGGSGDLAAKLAHTVGPHGRVLLADINNAMLHRGRARLADEGLSNNVRFVQADAERLPFADNAVDRITMAFGLRNVTDKDAALRSMFRVLRPGGCALILEFSAPRSWLRPAYDFYSLNVLPALGKLVARDADSYRYLAESIRMHPDQQALLAMLQSAGFERCQHYDLSGGIVAVHRGYKL